MTGAERKAALALIGAVIGAGFASGREINAFFARFGTGSWLGIACAALVLAWLLKEDIPLGGCPRGVALAWRWTFSALSAATGGAMLACAGEITALLLPVRGAYAIGFALTLAGMWLFSGHTLAVMSYLSAGLTVLLAGLMIGGLFWPGTGAALPGPDTDALHAALSGACYGGFNAALALPVLTSGRVSGASRRRAVWTGCAALAVLLALGNAAMLCHPELRAEPMPLLGMTRALGRTGYLLCAAALLLSVLSTLLACAAGLALTVPRGKTLGPALIAAVALLGFSGIVERVYPVLGGACFVLLAALRVGQW